MNKFIFFFFAITMCLCTTVFSEIYRSVDKEGNVVYSDLPDINSEKLDLPELSTYESRPKKEIKKDTDEQSERKEDQTPSVSYSGFRILSPANNDTIRHSAGDVPVQLQVTPKLRVKLGHRFVLSIDGKKVASATVPRYKLINIERGSHTLTAQIVDRSNKALSRPVSVSFHMHRFSKLFKKP